MEGNGDAMARFRSKMEKAKRAKRTIQTYEWHLDNYFKAINKSPNEFVEGVLARRLDPVEVTNDITDRMIGDDKLSPHYTKLTVCAVKKFVKIVTGKPIEFFSENGLDEIGIRTKNKETPLEVSHLRRFMAACRTPRDRALLALASCSGLRLNELANLQMKDVIHDEGKGRTVITVRDECAKGGHGYVTFCTNEAFQFLNEYWEQRRGEGESLGPDSFVFVTTKGRTRKKTSIFILGTTFREIFRRAKAIPEPNGEDHSNRIRHEIRPHSLRKFCRRMYSKTIETEDAEKLIGHALTSLVHVYTPKTIDELWEAYQKAIPRLVIQGPSEILDQATTSKIAELTERDARLKVDLEKLKQENASLRQELAEYSGGVKDRLESLERMRDELKELVKKR
jgi:integrase